MAKSLIEKLNMLVRSSVGEFMAEVGDRLPDLSLARSRDLDFEVDALRRRINDALSYEDRLDAELQKLLDEIETVDRAADEAVAAGDDPRARLLVARLKRMQQRAAMLEDQLQQHRAAAAELIAQVNYLDSLVGDIERRRQVEKEIGRELPQLQTPPRAAEPARAEPPQRKPEPARPEAPRLTKTVRIPVTTGGDEPARPQAEAEQRLARPETPPPAAEAPMAEAPTPVTELRQTPKAPPAEAAPPAGPERYKLPKAMEREPAAPVEAATSKAGQKGQPEKPPLPELERLTQALRKARENVEQAERTMDTAQAWKAQFEGEQPPWPEIPDEGPAPGEVDAELAARRARLSRPE